MDSQTRPDSPWKAAGDLLAHLQRCPQDVAKPPRELALQFGLDEGFVRTVVSGAQIRQPEATGPSGWTRFWRKPAAVWKRCNHAIGRLMDRPVFFANCVAVAWAVGCYLIGLMPSHEQVVDFKPEQAAFIISARGYLYVAWTLLAFVLAMATLCRGRMARHALWHGLFMVGLWSTMTAIPSILNAKSSVSTIVMKVLISFFGFTFLGLVYAGFGALIAVLGGYVSLKVSDRDRSQLSRHELLGRYFELQVRLQRMSGQTQGPSGSRFIAWIRDRVFVCAFVGALLLGLGIVGLVALTGIEPNAANRAAMQAQTGFAIFMLGSMAIGFLSVVLHIGLSYLSGSVVRSLAVNLLGVLGSTIAELVPVPGLGARIMFSPEMLIATAVTTLIWCAIGSVAALGAMVQARASRDRRLAANDPATVLSEILQIQMQLSEGTTPVCVLVIDAAKSSEMKSNADALVAEYSFRAYQAWIERHSVANQGSVHATAGDGAVVAFSTCGQALAAANAMLDDLPRFNASENRLDRPFRVRIGLHVGTVVAALDKVEFTEVIDIAAHIEGAAPIGGIAVTEAVTLEMAGTRFEPTGQVIDNQRVFLARKPT